MSRLDTAALLRLGEQLPPEQRGVLETVARLHLMSHAQMACLLSFSQSNAQSKSESAARRTRRVLSRLTELGLLARLQRRVGGVRAGSSGFIYYLGPEGQRLIGYWQGEGLVRGRQRPDPGGRYVRHRLAVGQLLIDLKQAEAVGHLDLLAFDVEPDCWRTQDSGLAGSTLIKPDAYVRVGVGAYEERAFVEVDLGTESRPVIARKLRTYVSYYKSGQEQAAHGVFPRVVLLVPSEARKTALVGVCSRLPAEDWRLFTVGLLANSVEALRGEFADQDDLEAEALT